MDTSASLDVAQALAKQSARRRSISGRILAGVIPSSWALGLILALQAIIAVTTLRNTVFQDEGLYLYAGRQILRYWMGGPAPVEQYGFYFSGYPYVYPVIGGFLDKIGGLELARDFSLVCMLGVTVLTYVCTRKLFPPAAAIFASAAYAYLGTVLFVSRLATFDPLCLFLIALATAVACRVGAARRPWMALMLGPLLVLSVLTKYAAMLFIPSVLGLVIFGSIAFQGWRRMPLRFVIAVVTLGVSLAVAYHFMDRIALHAIVGSTTDRVSIVEKPRLEMLLHLGYMGGVVYAAALVGLVLVFMRYPRFRLIALILFASAWLTPAYHIYKQEAVSYDKHIAFSLFFAMPLAGYAIAWLASGMQRAISSAEPLSLFFALPLAGNAIAWPAGGMERTISNPEGQQGRAGGQNWLSAAQYGLAGVAVVLIVVTLGIQQARTIYAGWGDTSGLSTVLHTQMRDGSGRYLAEDIEVARYGAQDITEPWQWNGPYYFYYVTASQQELLGDPAVAQAIKDQYFVLVELSFVHSPGEAHFVAEQMAASRNYDLIARVFFEGDLVDGGPLGSKYGSGYYYVWRSALVAGEGTFTSLSQIGM
jgi:4-amino-4-deoxy-L-arabinose transferase-like glycosyltransferase